MFQFSHASSLPSKTEEKKATQPSLHAFSALVPKKQIPILSSSIDLSDVCLSQSAQDISLINAHQRLLADKNFEGVVALLLSFGTKIKTLHVHFSFPLTCWNLLIDLAILAASCMDETTDTLNLTLLEGELQKAIFGARETKEDSELHKNLNTVKEILVQEGKELADLIHLSKTSTSIEAGSDSEKRLLQIVKKLMPITEINEWLFETFNQKSLQDLRNGYKERLDEKFRWRDFQNNHAIGGVRAPKDIFVEAMTAAFGSRFNGSALESAFQKVIEWRLKRIQPILNLFQLSHRGYEKILIAIATWAITHYCSVEALYQISLHEKEFGQMTTQWHDGSLNQVMEFVSGLFSPRIPFVGICSGSPELEMYVPNVDTFWRIMESQKISSCFLSPLPPNSNNSSMMKVIQSQNQKIAESKNDKKEGMDDPPLALTYVPVTLLLNLDSKEISIFDESVTGIQPSLAKAKPANCPIIPLCTTPTREVRMLSSRSISASSQPSLKHFTQHLLTSLSAGSFLPRAADIHVTANKDHTMTIRMALDQSFYQMTYFPKAFDLQSLSLLQESIFQISQWVQNELATGSQSSRQSSPRVYNYQKEEKWSQNHSLLIDSSIWLVLSPSSDEHIHLLMAVSEWTSYLTSTLQKKLRKRLEEKEIGLSTFLGTELGLPKKTKSKETVMSPILSYLFARPCIVQELGNYEETRKNVRKAFSSQQQ